MRPIVLRSRCTTCHGPVETIPGPVRAAIAARYPEAPVVLTWRDPESWWTSYENTLLRYDGERGYPSFAEHRATRREFLAGAATAFFFVFRPVLNFLFQFNRAMNIDPDPRINLATADPNPAEQGSDVIVTGQIFYPESGQSVPDTIFYHC